MKIRALSAAVYLMGGLLSLTLAVAFASWILRPSLAQDAVATEVSSPAQVDASAPPQTEAPKPPEPNVIPPASAQTEVVPPPPPPEVSATIPPPSPSLPPEPVNGSPVIPPAAAASKGQTLNLPARDFLEPYIFDAREGRRNPFRPLSLQGEDDGSMALGPATPLERFEVDELKLLAIMWDVKSPRAMVMDPNKEIHIVGKDDRIGRRKGYIATIREGEIVIVETSEFNGEAVYSTRIMQITK